MMNAFERHLTGDMGIPIHEASAFFLAAKSPIKTASAANLTKTAGWNDPPDETGVLEGQFEVPVQNVVALMGNTAMNLLRLMNAGLIYSNSIRGPFASEVKQAIRCNEWDHKNAFEYMVSRMTVLAGPPTIPEPDVPPASTDPVAVAQRMIRAEQEMVHAYHELCAVLGCNPMKEKIKEFAATCQRHLDDIWMALPPEFGNKVMVPKDPVKLLKHEQMESPAVEAVESPEFQQAEEAAGVEPPEHEAMEVQAQVKTASARTVKTAAALMVKWAKEETDAELQEKGRQRGVANIAAEHTRERARRGERAGRALGAAGGIAAGGALGKKLIGGKAGTLGGAALGGLVGRSLGGELGTEVDMARSKTAAERGWGEAIGSIGGGILGGAGGAAAAGLAGLPSGPGALALGGAGMTAGGMAGEAAGGALGKKVDEMLARRKKAPGMAPKPVTPTAKVASAMVAWVKTADPSMAAGAPMAMPTDAPELEPLNYMQAEQIGRGMQDMNEANFHKARAARAEMAAQQAVTDAQLQAEQVTMEAQQAIAQAQGAEALSQEMMGTAMQAKDEALKQTEVAARLRMATQDLRMQLMNLASQEPDQAAAMELASSVAPAPASPGAQDQAAAAAQAAQPPPPPTTSPSKAQEEVEQAGRAQDEAAIQGMQAEQAAGGGMEVQASARIPDAGLYPDVGPLGPAGKAPAPRTAPGSSPPEGQPDMNANSSGPLGPDPSTAERVTKQAAGYGFLGGAAIGAGSMAYDTKKKQNEGLSPAQTRVQQLSETQDGSFAQAAALARAKKDLADRELMSTHPGQTLGSKTLQGAFRGGMAGSALENNLRYLMR